MPTKLCLKSDLRPSIGQGIDSTVAPVNVVTEHIKKVPGIRSEIDLLTYLDKNYCQNPNQDHFSTF